MVKRLNPVVLAILFLTSGISFAAEKCDLLENAPPDRLVSYLDGMVRGTVRGREMVECIVFAIKKLSNQRYEPGIPAVTRFLDFHWPLSLAWIIHQGSSQKRKDALKGMMNTGFADPAFPFGASIT